MTFTGERCSVLLLPRFLRTALAPLEIEFFIQPQSALIPRPLTLLYCHSLVPLGEK